MFGYIYMYRSGMDGGGTQAVLNGIAESRERRLERDIKELCQDTYTYSGGKPCSEVLSPPKQS